MIQSYLLILRFFCTIRPFSRNFFHMPISWILFTQHFQRLSFILKLCCILKRPFSVESESGTSNLILLHKVTQFSLYHFLTFPCVCFWYPWNFEGAADGWVYFWNLAMSLILRSVFVPASWCLWCHSSRIGISPASCASCLGLHYYLGILCFPLNFRIHFYAYMKSIIRILFWIALITRHNKHYGLFTILSLPTHMEGFFIF